MSALGNAATYGLPVGAIGLAAAVILGPGAQRMAVGVKVWGAPVEGGEALSLRIEGARRLLGVEDAAALDGLEVTAMSAGAALEGWRGGTGGDGIGEALLAARAGLAAPVVVRVVRGGEVLLEREVPLSPAVSIAADEAAVPGATQGELRVQVEVARGAMAAPFPGELRVRVTGPGGAPAAGARVEVTAEGAEIAGGERVAVRETDGAGEAAVEVTPRSHGVEVSVEAQREGAAGQWVGELPVVPGAIWVEPPAEGGAAMRLRLVAPAPRERAYVSVMGERGRVLGAVVPLARDAVGFWSGEVTLELGGARALGAVVAGDPYEQGAGTIAWPIAPAAEARGGRGVSPRRIALLADGLPAAEARERARAGRARSAGLAVVGAAAIAEVLLLLVRSRRAQRRWEAHLEEAGGGPGGGAGEAAPLAGADRERLLASARAEPALRVLAFAALVGLAFAMVAALATFR